MTIEISIPQPIQVSIETTNPTLLQQLQQLQQQIQALGSTLAQLDNFQLSDSDLSEISNLATAPFGRGLLTLASLAEAKQLLQIPQIVDSPDDIGAQPADGDLSAIALLSTTPFGRELLTQPDAAAVLTALGLGSGNTGSGGTISELTYTVSQSSVFGNPATDCIGTFANLTNDSNQTGAGTLNAGVVGSPQWIQADLGQSRNVLSCTVAGGTLPVNFGAVAEYLNGAQVQVSPDASSWEVVTLVSGAVNTDFLNITRKPTPTIIPIHRNTRYIRLYSPNSWLGTTELRIRGW